MQELLHNIFATEYFIPHGHCYLWQPELVWLHILSDSLIALAYYSIPIALVYFVRKRQDLPFNGIFLLFGTFIVACGTTHIMEVWTLWHPTYWLSGLIKAITATVSIYTAICLVTLLPQALALPSLAATNQKLEREMIERQQAEAALRRSEEQHRLLAKNFPNGAVVLFDRNLRFTLVDGAGLAAIGLSKELMEGKTVSEIFPPETSNVLEPNYQAALGGEENTFEAPFKNRIYQVNTLPVKNSSEEIFAGMAVVLDITERKQSQASLRKAKDELEMRVAERTAELISVNRRLQLELDERKQIEEALRVSQARFSGILEIAEDAIISIDATQRINLFNQGAEKIFGYTAQEVLGKPLDLLLPERFVAIHRQHVVDFAESHTRARRMGERREIFARHKDGADFPAEASISKLVLAGETIFTVILRDITERHQVERMKDEFVSVVSHELRTPLTSIHGSLGILASGLLKAQPEKAQRLLQIAVDSTERLVRLINDILDIERIESGKVKMEKQTCNAADLINQAIEVMQSVADKARITLSVSIVSVMLQADPDRVVQTLTNLLSNAVKFSPSGATVWLSAEVQEVRESERVGEWESHDSFHPSRPYSLTPSTNFNQILFKVEDKGRGIPANKLETIFERFQQVDASDSRKNEGTGLGLAICRSIVEQHGGHIWVESTLGEGSTFYFTLPIEGMETVTNDE